MSRVAVVISICFLAVACFAQGRLSYRNSDWHFSLVSPEGWEFIPEDELPNGFRERLEKEFESETVAICKKVDADYFETPYIIVQIKSSQEIPEKSLHELFVEHRELALKVLEKNAENLQRGKHFSMLKFWNGAKRTRTDFQYDKLRHIAFETAELHHKSLGKIIAVTVKLLGSHRMASLQCFADGEDAKGFLDLVDEVVDSFAYDRGYGFGEGRGIAPGLTQHLQKKSRKSWILWVVVIIVFSWLTHRWVTR